MHTSYLPALENPIVVLERSDDAEESALTTHQVAVILGVGMRTIYNWIKREWLIDGKHYRIMPNGRYHWNRRAIMRFLNG